MDPIDWLLESDPSVRWQALRDLTDAAPDVVAAERGRVATEGQGARLLALQDPDGHWAGAEWDNDRKSVYWTLHTLRRFGVDPDAAPVRSAIQKVHENVVWKYWDDRSYFGGEVEPCINGGVLAQGAYFGVLGEGSDRLIGMLLDEQLEEGGWNCDAPESTRSSFDSTLNVLEGLLEYERAVGADVPEVTAARRRGEEFLLERGLFRRLTTGEIAQPRYRNFSFPPYWFYDVLRSLDYVRSTGASVDPRVADAVDLVRARRTDDGRWLSGVTWPGEVWFDIDAPEGEPSRWNTLRALRVLRWYEGAES